MIIVMKPEATTAELEAVKNKITDAGLNFTFLKVLLVLS